MLKITIYDIHMKGGYSK